MLVSINIVAYNEEQNIEKTLLAALNQSYRPIEIFLIDNASKDKTIEIAESVYRNSGSDVKFEIIRNSENFGFGGGHNIGIEKSSGNFVLCLNADCELDRDYVKYAIEGFNLPAGSQGSDKNIAAVQGKLQNPRTKKMDTAGLVFF